MYIEWADTSASVPLGADPDSLFLEVCTLLSAVLISIYNSSSLLHSLGSRGEAGSRMPRSNQPPDALRAEGKLHETSSWFVLQLSSPRSDWERPTWAKLQSNTPSVHRALKRWPLKMTPSVLADSIELVPRALTPDRSGEPGPGWDVPSQYLCRESLPLSAAARPCSPLWALSSLCTLTCNMPRELLHSEADGFPSPLPFYHATHICCSRSRQRLKQFYRWNSHEVTSASFCVPTFQPSFVPSLPLPLSLRWTFCVRIFNKHSDGLTPALKLFMFLIFVCSAWQTFNELAERRVSLPLLRRTNPL